MMQKQLFNGKRILVVDDETVVLQTLDLIFGPGGSRYEQRVRRKKR